MIDIEKATYKFKSGDQKGNIYSLGSSVCDNPLCDCTNLTLFLYEEQNDLTQQEHKYKVVLDVEGPSKQTEGYVLTEEDIEFADEFIKDLSTEDFDSLKMIFRSIKAYSTENADLTNLRTEFPEEIADGSMAGYTEVFPHGERFMIETNGHKLWVDDQHCVQPGCKCTELALHFMLEEEGHGNIHIGKQYVTIVYDYKKKNWKEVRRSGVEGVTQTACIEPLLEKYEHFPLRIVKRDNQMKRLYKNSQKKARLEARGLGSGNTTPAGRNEPCPCGSGKKYKKCCGK